MDEYGAEISQQGIPVKQATDDQKVIDTRWVTLDVQNVYEYNSIVTVPLNDGGATQSIVLCTHNSGFLPAYDYVINSYSLSTHVIGETFNFYADATNIYLVPFFEVGGSSIVLTINVTIRVYTLPITQSFQAPTVQSISAVNETNTGYGIEFVTEANASPQISEDPVGEYSFSTRLKPLNILQTGTYTVNDTAGVPNSGYIVINYSYPQNPLYQLCQYYPSGISSAALSMTQALVGPLGYQGAKGSVGNGTILIAGSGSALSGSFAYILFKDPIGLTQ